MWQLFGSFKTISLFSLCHYVPFSGGQLGRASFPTIALLFLQGGLLGFPWPPPFPVWPYGSLSHLQPSLWPCPGSMHSSLPVQREGWGQAFCRDNGMVTIAESTWCFSTQSPSSNKEQLPPQLGVFEQLPQGLPAHKWHSQDWTWFLSRPRPWACPLWEPLNMILWA